MIIKRDWCKYQFDGRKWIDFFRAEYLSDNDEFLKNFFGAIRSPKVTTRSANSSKNCYIFPNISSVVKTRTKNFFLQILKKSFVSLSHHITEQILLWGIINKLPRLGIKINFFSSSIHRKRPVSKELLNIIIKFFWNSLIIRPLYILQKFSS